MTAVIGDSVFSSGGERSRIRLSFNALMVAEATAKEWEERDKKAAHISKGEVVVEFNRNCLPLKPGATFEIDGLISNGLANILLVIGHQKDSEDDFMPICVAVNRDSRTAPLMLLPIAFNSLADEK